MWLLFEKIGKIESCCWLLIGLATGMLLEQMWIFDTSDGEARLIRSRSGHSASPTLYQVVIINFLLIIVVIIFSQISTFVHVTLFSHFSSLPLSCASAIISVLFVYFVILTEI